jgi:hypothetical protein
MISLSKIWRRFDRSQHASSDLAARIRSLESEIARLRAENRALLNSILGIAGMKPLPPDASFYTPAATAGHSESSPPPRATDRPLLTPTASSSTEGVPSAPPQRQSETRNGSSHSSPASTPRQLQAPPHRRRSWHQINRMLEIQSARKDSDA